MKEDKNNARCQMIIETARALFWKYGLKRVTVEEICREAGVSKMTFYKFFQNKIELAKEVYTGAVEDGIAKFRGIMDSNETTPEEKMERIILLKLEGTNDISSEFISDFYNNPELGLSEWVEKKSSETWKVIMEDFRKAQEKRWIRKDFKPEGLLLIISKLSELIREEQMLQLYNSPQEVIMELTRFFTYGILSRVKHDAESNKKDSIN